jgi:hypothetical protein
MSGLGNARRTPIPLVALLALCLATAGGPPGPALAEAGVTTTNVSFPLGYGVWVPCAAGGAGEVVELDGTLHSVYHVTFDSAGGLHVHSHFNSQDVSGVGLSSGNRYRSGEASDSEFNANGVQLALELSFEHQLNLIGQGTAPNLRLREHEHLTVNADGSVTALSAEVVADCD